MCTIYAFPLQRREQVNEQATPHFIDWYRRCHARPGIRAAFALGHAWWPAGCARPGASWASNPEARAR